jgi:hypothetical protein
VVYAEPAGAVETRYRLRCLQGGLRGTELDLLSPFKTLTPVVRDLDPIYPKAPDLCLAAFDELTALGLDAFTRKHDPYWDIPLNMNLPKPVIDLPGLPQDAGADGHATAESSTVGFTLAPIEDRPPGRGRPPKVVPAPRPVIGDLFASQPVELRGAVEAYGTIKRLLDQWGVITSVDAQMATGLESADVRPMLKKLVDEGFARVEGVTKGTRYVRIRGAVG